MCTAFCRALVLLTAAVAAASLTVPAAVAAPGEDETTAGNNLSYPLIWGEGPGLTIPGTFGSESLTGDSALVDHDGDAATDPIQVWLQQDLGNTWQAGSWDALANGQALNVDTVDWGDNLSGPAQKQAGKPIRVETSMFKNLGVTGFPASLIQYPMFKVGDATGQNEMWGTNGQEFESVLDAMVYSKAARLTIQRLMVDPDDPAVDALTWYAKDGKWVGTGITEPKVNLVTGTGEDGPGSYGAELNIQGKVVYGYNWTADYGGVYRITFSLDAANNAGVLNTNITDDTALAVSEEETSEEPTVLEAAPGGTEYIDGADNLTYVDVVVTGTAAPSEPSAKPSDYVPPVVEPPVTPPTTTATPPVQEQTQQQAGQTPSPVAPRQCRARERFTFRLGDQLKLATRSRMRLVERVIATLDGKRIKATKGSKGITVPVDLRRKTRTTARLRVELRLRRAITMNGENGSYRTTRVVRVWTFPTCAGAR